MTIVQSTPGAYELQGPDLYKDIHKSIRVMLFEAVADAGRLDAADRDARRAHAASVRSLIEFLVLHAEHEDAEIDGVLATILPAQAAAITDAHVELEARMLGLQALADLVEDDTRTDDRGAVHELYLELAAFTADYLLHQDVEERVVMPALLAALGPVGVLEVHGRIVASIPPEEMGRSLSVMLPAMNVDDRTEMLGGMRAQAPAEVFASVWELAGSVLSPADRGAVAGRLGLVGATGGAS